MKKINTALLAVTLTFGASTSAMAQLGGLGNLMGGSKAVASTGNLDADVQGFLGKSTVINRLSAIALVAISSAYDKDADVAGAQAKISKLNSVTDPKEQQALVAEVQKTEGAKVAQLAQASNLAEQTKSLTQEKQKLVGTAVSNFLIAGLRAVDLTKSGQGIVQGAASNPMSITKIVPVKDALPLLGDAAGNATKIMPKFVDVLRGANIDVPKVTADSKEVSINSI
jgi:hypothetical protein